MISDGQSKKGLRAVAARHRTKLPVTIASGFGLPRPGRCRTARMVEVDYRLTALQLFNLWGCCTGRCSGPRQGMAHSTS